VGASKLSHLHKTVSAVNTELRKTVELLLFVQDKPISIKDFHAVLGEEHKSEDILTCLEQIGRELVLGDKPYTLENLSGGWQLLTRPQYDGLIRKLIEVERQDSLTKAQLETLAIIAYSQPITKGEIESIRGVGCGPVLKTLQEKDIIRVVGRADRLGAPVLYGTTKHFLDLFGLKELGELPERDDIIKTFKKKLHSEKKSAEVNEAKDHKEVQE